MSGKQHHGGRLKSFVRKRERERGEDRGDRDTAGTGDEPRDRRRFLRAKRLKDGEEPAEDIPTQHRPEPHRRGVDPKHRETAETVEDRLQEQPHKDHRDRAPAKQHPEKPVQQ